MAQQPYDGQSILAADPMLVSQKTCNKYAIGIGILCGQNNYSPAAVLIWNCRYKPVTTKILHDRWTCS